MTGPGPCKGFLLERFHHPGWLPWGHTSEESVGEINGVSEPTHHMGASGLSLLCLGWLNRTPGRPGQSEPSIPLANRALDSTD